MNDIVRPVTDDGQVGYDQYDQFIYKQPHPTEPDWCTIRPISDVRDKTCAICGRGWEMTGPSLGDQFHWQLVDDWVHDTCLARHAGLRQREEFYYALVDARVRFRGLKPVDNGYHGARGRWVHVPWYHAPLIDHPARFVVGRRKRVDHVEVVPEGGTKLDWWERAQEAFAEADVTKHFNPSSVLLHAWTSDKMRVYIETLAQIAGYQVQR